MTPLRHVSSSRVLVLLIVSCSGSPSPTQSGTSVGGTTSNGGGTSTGGNTSNGGDQSAGGSGTNGGNTGRLASSCPGTGGPAMVMLPLGYCIDSTEVTQGAVPSLAQQQTIHIESGFSLLGEHELRTVQRLATSNIDP